MAKETKRVDAYSPKLRLVVTKDGKKEHVYHPPTKDKPTTPEGPIYLYVKKAKGAGSGIVRRHHTGEKGRLCRFIKADRIGELQRGSHFQKTGKYTFYRMTEEYHGLCSAEVLIDPSKLQNSDLQKLNLVREPDVKGGTLHVDWPVSDPKYASRFGSWNS